MAHNIVYIWAYKYGDLSAFAVLIIETIKRKT